ncbi:MAG: PilW family protein [Ferrimonas sp.]
MMAPPPCRGFTLTELLVALALGISSLACIYSLLVVSHRSVISTRAHQQLQQSGRLALRILQQDIAQAGFFAELTGTDLATTVRATVPLAAAEDCRGGGSNNGSYPNDAGFFRVLWATAEPDAYEIGCARSAVPDSDLLQLKRLDGVAINQGYDPSEIYMALNAQEGHFFVGIDGPPWLAQGRQYRYRHRLYFVALNSAQQPTLYMHDLSASGMARASALVEGVEAIEFLMGVDRTGDGVVDQYVRPDDVAESWWDQSSQARIVAIQIQVLLVSLQPDPTFDSSTLRIAMASGERTVKNDGRRRLLLSAMLILHNAQHG